MRLKAVLGMVTARMLASQQVDHPPTRMGSNASQRGWQNSMPAKAAEFRTGCCAGGWLEAVQLGGQTAQAGQLWRVRVAFHEGATWNVIVEDERLHPEIQPLKYRPEWGEGQGAGGIISARQGGKSVPE